MCGDKSVLLSVYFIFFSLCWIRFFLVVFFEFLVVMVVICDCLVVCSCADILFFVVDERYWRYMVVNFKLDFY